MILAQECINGFDSSVQKLNLSRYGKSETEKLSGSADFSEFTQLTELNVSYNQLTELIFPVNNQLKVLHCSGNPQLKSDFLLKLKAEQMTYLNLDGDLVDSQLGIYLQSGEKRVDKYVSNLASGEVNYVTLLIRWQRAQQRVVKVSDTSANVNMINIKFASNKLTKFLSSWTQEQLIQFIKTQAHPQIEELLEDFLSSQELLATANEKHRKVLQQTYQQAKNELAAVISQEEINALETAYEREHQVEIEQKTAAIEERPPTYTE